MFCISPFGSPHIPEDDVLKEVRLKTVRIAASITARGPVQKLGYKDRIVVPTE